MPETELTAAPGWRWRRRRAAGLCVRQRGARWARALGRSRRWPWPLARAAPFCCREHACIAFGRPFATGQQRIGRSGLQARMRPHKIPHAQPRRRPAAAGQGTHLPAAPAAAARSRAAWPSRKTAKVVSRAIGAGVGTYRCLRAPRATHRLQAPTAHEIPRVWARSSADNANDVLPRPAGLRSGTPLPGRAPNVFQLAATRGYSGLPDAW